MSPIKQIQQSQQDLYKMCTAYFVARESIIVHSSGFHPLYSEKKTIVLFKNNTHSTKFEILTLTYFLPRSCPNLSSPILGEDYSIILERNNRGFCLAHLSTQAGPCRGLLTTKIDLFFTYVIT